MLHLSRAQAKRPHAEDAETGGPSKRPRVEDSAAGQLSPTRRPTPAPRRLVQQLSATRPISDTGLVAATRPDSVNQIDNECEDSSNVLPSSMVRQPDQTILMQSMISQMTALQETNRLERQQMLADQERDRQMFMSTIAAVSAKVDAISNVRNAPIASVHSPIAGQDTHPVVPPPTPSTSRQAPNSLPGSATPAHPSQQAPPRALMTPGSSLQAQSMPPTREQPFPQGQPTPADITPAQLQQELDPVKTLRRNDSSAQVADHILEVVGILKNEAQGNKSKTKHSSRKKVAKWPSDYVFRINDDEPSYDSLSTNEFMAGYLCIIEESLPNTPDNAAAIKHIQYARHLMEDCPGLGWSTVRMAHKQVMLAMDYARLKWADTEAVYKTKADAIRRLTNMNFDSTPTHVLCQAFQNYTCTFEGDHVADGVTQFHWCSHCYTLGKQFTHPLANCMKTKGKGKDASKSKNTKGRKPPKQE